MIVSSIVAVSENNVIGKDNDLPWSMPDDMRYFMRTTSGHHIIMGRKNFSAMNHRPLRNRTNIILTRDPFFVASDVFVFQDLREALDFCEDQGEEETFIIGGAQVYALAMPLIDRLYLTRIHTHIDGDVFFPNWNRKEFTLTSEKHFKADERNPYDYSFYVYERLDGSA